MPRERPSHPYDASHASRYLNDYHRHPFWRPKVRENERLLTRLMALVPEGGVWLDLCCGPAQHFGLAREDLRCIGVDRAHAQLEQARLLHGPGRHEFLCADLRRAAELDIPAVHLVTSFWGALSYLEGEEEWSAVLRAVTGRMADGAVLYLENPSVETLMDFNDTEFARANSFSVRSVESAGGWSRWRYEDAGGSHAMFTPAFQTLRSLLADLGFAAQRLSIVQTIQQIVATRGTAGFEKIRQL